MRKNGKHSYWNQQVPSLCYIESLWISTLASAIGRLCKETITFVKHNHINSIDQHKHQVYNKFDTNLKRPTCVCVTHQFHIRVTESSMLKNWLFLDAVLTVEKFESHSDSPSWVQLKKPEETIKDKSIFWILSSILYDFAWNFECKLR